MKVYRSKRRTLSISVTKEGELVVRAPLGMKESKIQEFLDEKRAWIQKSMAKVNQKQSFANSFDFENNFYLLGGCEPIPETLKYHKRGEKFPYEKFYKDNAKRILPNKAKEISNLVGLQYKALKIVTSKRIWGSFNKDGTMKLNYKLVILPENLITYVIVHELCHGVQLNHSPKFWALVGQALPNYKQLKKQLDNYGFLL